MKEKVVYLLGAGFSAPLGIPVMTNFFSKSKDLYYDDPAKFPHFADVFETIKEMSIIKNYYQTDLFNIEEILSILEMREFLEGGELKANFLQYLVDVVSYYTPQMHPYGPKLPGNWYDVLFGAGRDSIWQGYSHFISAICNLNFWQSRGGFTGEHAQIYCRANPDPNVIYSIVTLNYDCVPESVVKFIKSTYSCETSIDLRIAKLHGSVDSGVIVPPTWSKGANKKIVPAWKQAYDCLTEANHLRIIGFSLPTADAYVKFLLKSAVTKAPHLKAIDVICLDADGSAQRRYDDFMSFANYRFRNANVTDYLSNIKYNAYESTSINFEKLENAHSAFFK